MPTGDNRAGRGVGGRCPKEHSHGRSSCQGSIRPGLLPSSLPFAPPSSIPASVFPPLPTPPLPVFSQPRVARTRETTSPTKLNPKCANKTTTNAPPMVKTHRKPGGSLSLEQLHGCWQRPSRPPRSRLCLPAFAPRRWSRWVLSGGLAGRPGFLFFERAPRGPAAKFPSPEGCWLGAARDRLGRLALRCSSPFLSAGGVPLLQAPFSRGFVGASPRPQNCKN